MKYRNTGNLVICMKCTHGTTDYDFCFVTVLTKDGSGEGFPRAHMFSNREDAVALKFFLNGVRKTCGKIACSAFMSDDADQYF